MKVTRTSVFSGITRTLELDITQEQLDNYYVKRMYLQEAFHNLSPEDREFIKSGITVEEWDNTFSDDIEEENKDPLKINISYFKRMWNVILFFSIWVGVPYLIYRYTGIESWLILVMIMWLPALGIVLYLESED